MPPLRLPAAPRRIRRADQAGGWKPPGAGAAGAGEAGVAPVGASVARSHTDVAPAGPVPGGAGGGVPQPAVPHPTGGPAGTGVASYRAWYDAATHARNASGVTPGGG